MPSLPFSQRRKPIYRTQRGFSLTEMLVTIAVIGILAAVAYAGISGWRDATQERRLVRDVAVLNSAVSAYELSGGDISQVTTLENAITKLRSVAALTGTDVTIDATGATAAGGGGVVEEGVGDVVRIRKGLVGLKDSMIDPRLTAEMMTDPDEIDSTAPRVVWNSGSRGFEISRAPGVLGVKRFYLGDDLNTIQQESRGTSLQFATRENNYWVWDYTDGGTADDRGPTRIEGDPRDVPTTAGGANSDMREKLESPVFVPGAEGTFTLVEYDTLDPVIDFAEGFEWQDSLGDIYFRKTDIDGNVGGFEIYNGVLGVLPGDLFEALVVSTDPDHFLDSQITHAVYNVVPEKPVLEVLLADNSFTYAELGGTMMAGSPPANPIAEPAVASLEGGSASRIPDSFESSDYFQMVWAHGEGVDPFTSADASVGEVAFESDFGIQPIPFTYSDFPETGDLILNVATKTAEPRRTNTRFIVDSDVSSTTVPREVVEMPVVVFGPERGKLEIGDEVTLSFYLADGTVPANASIYYRTDGMDPGPTVEDAIANSSTAYTGPFVPFGVDELRIELVARAYPTGDAVPWFTSSQPHLESFYLEAPREESIWAIGGETGELYQIFDYRNPTKAFTVEWGEIQIADENGTRPITGGGMAPSAVGALAITDAGIGYFVRNAETVIGQTTASLPLFKIDLTVADGVPVTAEYLGDLAPEVAALGFGASAEISGLAIAPSGGLYGIVDVDPGATTPVRDIAIEIHSFEKDLDGRLYDISFVGETFGTAGSASGVQDIAFGNDGNALIADASGHTFMADPDTMTIGAIYDDAADLLPGNRFAGLAVRPVDGDIVASNVAGTRTNSLFGELWITPNAQYYDYATRIGEPLPAIAFHSHALAAPVIPPEPTVYAVDGTADVYLLDPGTGTHAVAAAGAPFPLGAVAHDSDSKTVYAVEAPTPGNLGRLAALDLGSGVFTELGSLRNPLLSIQLASDVTNLAFWCNSVWYIATGTDDLMRVRIVDGMIDDQFKIADLSDDVYTFGDVGDITIDSHGKLVFLDGDGRAFSFLIHTVSNFRELADEGLVPVQALAIDGTGAFVSVPATYTASHRIYNVDPELGVAAYLARTRPTRRFTDFALGQPLSAEVSSTQDQVLASIAPMTHYNVITFGNLTTNAEIEGRTFVGGSLDGGGADYATKLFDVIPSTEVTVSVAQSLNGNSPIDVEAGSVRIGDSNNGSGLNMIGGGSVEVGSDLVATGISLRMQLEEASSVLAGLEANGTVDIPTTKKGTLRFNVSSNGGTLAVFKVTAADVFGNNKVEKIELNMNGAEAAIINVSGKQIQWNFGELAEFENFGQMSGYLTGTEARKRVLWNFWEAESISFHRDMNGSVLAPLAHLSHNKEIRGSVVARSLSATGAIRLPSLNFNVFDNDNENKTPGDGCLLVNLDESTFTPPPVPPAGFYVAGRFVLSGSEGEVPTHRNIARLLTDGTLDSGFDPGTGTNEGSFVEEVVKTFGAAVMIGGDFNSFNGAARKGVLRMGSKGELDTTFNANLE